MDIARLSDLRPRFMWDIIDDAFDLYRERFALLLGITAVTFLPAALTYDLCVDHYVRPMADTSDRFWASLLVFWLILLPLYLCLTVIRMGAIATVVDGQFRGKPVASAWAAYGTAMRHAGPLIVVALFAAIVSFISAPTLLGLLYFIIGAAFLAPAVVLESRGGISAIKRSFSLTGTDRARIFGVILLLFGIVLALAKGLEGVVHLAYAALPMGDMTAVARETQQNVASQIVTGTVALTLEPLITIAITLLYFDLRVRRQGIDLSAQAEEFGVALAADPFGDLASANVVVKQERERKRAERKARRK